MKDFFSIARPGTLRPFFGYYGGKWRAAPRYPNPIYDRIVEPFAGSAGYSVRYAHLDVVLYDLDPIIAGVWDYLINVSPQEILSIPDVPSGSSVDDLHLVDEARWLVGFWLNSGVATPVKSPSAWMRAGKHKGSFWGPKIRNRIAQQVEQIRHWTIHNASYEEITLEGPSTWFVDPPYQVRGKYYRHGCKDIDFESLGSWCQERQGQIMVCENEGADWLPFRKLMDAKATTKGRKSSEALWVGHNKPTQERVNGHMESD